MSFALFVFRAYRIHKKLKTYEHEKENARKISEGVPPVYTISDKFRHFSAR
jgi:hypothetical protein